MKMIAVCFALFLCTAETAFAGSVGFQQFRLSGDTSRMLDVTLWYPTSQNTPIESVAENIAFAGSKVVKGAPVKPQKHPLVLLSHGYRGSWRNLNWLAYELVQKGFVVAAVDHPGTTTFDHSELQASQWWQRPRDLVRLLDSLLEDTVWRAVIDAQSISAIGHSLGGWSVMLLSGAQFDRSTFLKQCRLYPNPRTCGLASELGLTTTQPEEPKATNFRDARIKKTVILDLGLARSFSVESMKKVDMPVLILGAGIDIGDLPQSMESGYLAEHLPLFNRRYQVYEQATHFSFVQMCKPGAIALLEEEVAGDGIVCKDEAGISRHELHQQIFEDIYGFITR